MEAHNTAKKSRWPLFVGVLVLFLVFAVATKLLVGLTPSGADEDAARIAERLKAREELDTQNKQRLETYAWVDKAKGSVQIPIAQAMELTVAGMAGQQPRPAGPIVPAATPAPAEPAASPTAP